MNTIIPLLFRSILLCCALTMAVSERLPAASLLNFQLVGVFAAKQQPWGLLDSSQPLALDETGNIYGAYRPGDMLGFENVLLGIFNWVPKFSGDGSFITNWRAKEFCNGFPSPGITTMAVDKHKNVYALNDNGLTILKYGPTGKLITWWGGYGPTPGRFMSPRGLALDGEANVYVIDSYKCNVQKFTSHGVLIKAWGSYGTSDGQLQGPVSIAVDKERGYVYISDAGLGGVQKFTLDGRFITRWGAHGKGPGQFDGAWHIAVDRDGNIHVQDYWNYRIQKFTPDGGFIQEYRRGGWGEGRICIRTLAADNAGGIYTIQEGLDKYTTDGVFINAWRGKFPLKKELSRTRYLAVDGKNNIYITDGGFVLKYTPEGRFIKKWDGSGTDGGRFDLCSGIAVDKEGYVYVVERFNCRIQKFTCDGGFIGMWGSKGRGPGQFIDPDAIGVDDAGYVYVGDIFRTNIQKFDSNGKFIRGWQLKDGGLNGTRPQIGAICVDKAGDVYIADVGHSYIEKYSPKGEFLARWGGEKYEGGEFYLLAAIALDRDGNILADDGNHLFKYTPDGKLIGKWGELGSAPGQIANTRGLAIGSDGLIFRLGSDQVHILKEVQDPYPVKAVIAAAGGPLRDGTIWEQTEMNANFAYRTLLYQGLPKENIFYLSSDGGMDLDLNGKSDDVSARPIRANLNWALTQWAGGGKDVVVYLTGPGITGGLALSPGENLSPDDLISWLDELQYKITGRIILVVDASRSGNFLEKLTASASQNRIVITSTASREKAWFVHYGTVSFSKYFWTRIFNGDDLGSAFSHAREAMELGSGGMQHAGLEANGQRPSNSPDDLAAAGTIHIGNGSPQHQEIPAIASAACSKLEGDAGVLIAADGVTATDLIGRVWATIVPPGATPGSGTGSVPEVLSVDLLGKGAGHYEAVRAGMTEPGIYRIAVYALDRYGNTSIPIETTFAAPDK